MFTSPNPLHESYHRRFTFPSSPHLRPPTLLTLQAEQASLYPSSYTPSWLLSTSPLTPPSFNPLPSPPFSLPSPSSPYPDIQAFLAAELSRPILPLPSGAPLHLPLSSPPASSFPLFNFPPSTRSPSPGNSFQTSSTSPPSSLPSLPSATYTKAPTKRAHPRLTPTPHTPHHHSPSLHPPTTSRQRFNASCHMCKTSMPVHELSVCTSKGGGPSGRKRSCRKKFCGQCALRCYAQVLSAMTPADISRWQCPACLSLCYCAACTRQKAGAALPSFLSTCSPLSPLQQVYSDLLVSTSPSSSDSSALSLGSSLDTPVGSGGQGGEGVGMGAGMGVRVGGEEGGRPKPLRIPSPSMVGDGGWEGGEGGAPFVPLCIARESSIPFFCFPAEPHCAPRGGSAW